MGLGLLGGDCDHEVARSARRECDRDGFAFARGIKDSINKLGARKIIFVLGKHRRADFKTNKIIVVNPAVRESKYLAIAKNTVRVWRMKRACSSDTAKIRLSP